MGSATIDSLALGQVAIVLAGEELIAIASDNALIMELASAGSVEGQGGVVLRHSHR